MRTRSTLALATLAAAALVLTACGSSDGGDDAAATTAATAAPATTAATGEKDVVETALAAGGFTTLAAALQQSGLVDTLKGEGPFTVFAPTDEAFAAVPKGTLDALLADKEALTKVLTYHVVPAKVLAADVKAGDVATVEGSDVTFAVDGGTVTVNGAKVVTPDVMASNGVIHVIDQVLLPPDLDLAAPAATVADILAEPRFVQLSILLNAAGLDEVLAGPGPFTVFAPTNEALTAVGADTLNALQRDPAAATSLLTYHVVQGALKAADLKPGPLTTVNGAVLQVTMEGNDVLVNGVKVVDADLEAGNGVVHVIDGVLTPPAA